MDRSNGDGLSEDEGLRSHLLVVNPDVENVNCRRAINEVQKADDPAASSITLLLVFSVIIGCSGALTMGNALGYTSPTESEMMSDLSLTTSEYSLFSSLVNVGAAVGALLSGIVSDRIGRRYTMGLADILCIAGWITIAVSQNAWSLDVGRLLVGYGAGTFSYVSPTYVAEIAPKNLRGGGVSVTNMALACGITVMWMVGLLVNWRTLSLVGVVPCAIQILGLFIIPESPRWLLKVGRNEQYEATLQQLRGSHVDISNEAAEIKEHNETLQKIPNVNLIQIFQRQYAYALTVVLGLKGLSAASGVIGFLFYASSIFESAGFSSTIGTIALAIIWVASTVIGLFLTDNVGRKPLLVISAAGMSLGCFLSGCSFILEDHGVLVDLSPYFMLFGILMFFAFYPVGMAGVPNVIMSEMFPMHAKGSAGSLGTMISWSTQIVLSYCFTFMVNWSASGTFIFFGCTNAFSVWFSATLVQETKRKSLEEIHEYTTENGERIKVQY